MPNDRWFAGTVSVGDRSEAVARRRASREPDALFFVVGSARSGTNWLMRTLNAHPEIMCRGEGRFFGRDSRREQLKEMKTTEHKKRKMQPSSLYNALAESEYLRLWVERSVWTRDDDPDEHIARLTREAVRYFLTAGLSKSGKRIVGDKTPLDSLRIVTEIADILPEARVIHIIRDGRDTVVSQLHHVWNRASDEGGIHNLTPEERDRRDRYRADAEEVLRSGDGIFSERRLKSSANNWNRLVGAAVRDGPRALGERYTEVRYEDLLQRPETEFGRLFDFLGARADEETVTRCVGATNFENRSGGRERGQEDARSGVRKGVAGDWKRVFIERDKVIFKEIAGDLLLKLGYEQHNDW